MATDSNYRFLLGAGAALLLLTLSDFMSGTPNVQEAAAEKTPNFATKFMGPSIKFLYWWVDDFTVWKFMNFSVTLNLRQIMFDELKTSNFVSFPQRVLKTIKMTIFKTLICLKLMKYDLSGRIIRQLCIFNF